MAVINYEAAAASLGELFAHAETAFLEAKPPTVSQEIESAATRLFSSNTQSYREVLLGCALARLQNRQIKIRLPYANQGDEAFNGRTLDERVVNPFLQDRRVPSSKGPYLAVFRRSVTLSPETRGGLKDKEGYDAMLAWVDALERTPSDDETRNLVLYLLYKFVELRDKADIPLSRISRLSLEQFEALISQLLQVQSGGLIPVLLTVAIFKTISSHFGTRWEVDAQGINVADKASGAGGDVTVSEGGKVLLAVEVTERPISRARVVSTFNTKIVTAGITDYLFVYSQQVPAEDARAAARTYFTQGHEINFLQATEWIIGNLATVGAEGRNAFTNEILALFEQAPGKIKVAWNDVVRGVVGA
jgi:SacI restriction endonuclease